jgi:asparagine synthase (glutamine-hydrolysing)
MTGICGLIGSSNDVQSKANAILSQMQRRGAESRIFSQDLPDQRRVVIGVRGSGIFPSFDKASMPIALDGVFFQENHKARGTTFSGLERLVQTPGAFSFLIPFRDTLAAGRDVIGQKPLYFGTTKEGTVGFSSLRSPLISVGIGEPKPVPPGQLIQVSQEGKNEVKDFSLKQPKEIPTDEHNATRKLEELFSDAVGKTVPRHSGIAFSGGLDSGLVAKVAKDEGLNPQLISVGLKGQLELEHSTRIAGELGLPIRTWELSESEVLDVLPDVVDMVETSDPTIVGISVPIYFACLKARQLGLDYIAAGQLSDELFGGYGRFEDVALNKDAGKLSTSMFQSVVAASSNDFDPGDKLAVAAGLELCCPFAHLPLVEYSLTIPSSLKVRVENGKAIRKYILRKLAVRQGLPESVVNRPKKAVQYSSGVQRLLLKEAKRRGVSLAEMLESFTR